jgi:hypothetical protein
VREVEQLYVEGETFDARGFKDGTAMIETKCFKAALRVPKWEAGYSAHEQIKNAPALFAPPWLMSAD